ncbi:MAG: putative leader peptide [Mycobacteriales bacterium]
MGLVLVSRHDVMLVKRRCVDLKRTASAVCSPG